MRFKTLFFPSFISDGIPGGLPTKFLAAAGLGLALPCAVLASNSNTDATALGKAALVGEITITGTETDGGVGDCSFVTVNITGDVEGTNDLGGGNDQVRFSVWDDGVEEDFEVVSIPVGNTITADVTLTFEGLVGVGAPGVGIVIYDGPDSSDPVLFNEDPFFPETVEGSCPGEGGAQPTNIPVFFGGGLAFLAALLGLLAVFRLRR